MIQLALALKTRLCVYMYLPYMCVYETTNVHTVVFMENWNFWDWVLSRDRGKRNNSMSQTPQLGKNKHNSVWRASQLCVCKYTHIYRFIYKHTYTKNMEYTYTHTLALNSVSHYIIYSPSLEALFSFDSSSWRLSLNRTEVDISKMLILFWQNGISGSQF